MSFSRDSSCACPGGNSFHPPPLSSRQGSFDQVKSTAWKSFILARARILEGISAAKPRNVCLSIQLPPFPHYEYHIVLCSGGVSGCSMGRTPLLDYDYKQLGKINTEHINPEISTHRDASSFSNATPLRWYQQWKLVVEMSYLSMTRIFVCFQCFSFQHHDSENFSFPFSFSCSFSRVI